MRLRRIDRCWGQRAVWFLVSHDPFQPGREETFDDFPTKKNKLFVEMCSITDIEK